MNTFMRFAAYCLFVISSQNVKTIEGYVVVNFEVARSSSLKMLKNIFVTAAEADINDSLKRNAFSVCLLVPCICVACF